MRLMERKELTLWSTSVDIGAPGTGNITTSPNNNYNQTTGTSVSAPLVAGAVALLYSAPCDNIAEQSILNPEVTALTIKEMIFTGAKASSSLQGITTQGAVLNVFQSIQALDRNCNANGDSIENSIKITPNTLSREDGNLIIDYRAKNANGDPIIMLFDSKGALILEKRVSETFFGFNRVNLSISNQLSSGVYFVSLIFPNKEVITEKIVLY